MIANASFPVHFTIPHNDEALLDGCTVTTFRSSGKGGQHVNKTDSAVRIRHHASGVVVTCQRERSQYLNKMIGLKKLRERLEKLLEVPQPRIPTRIPAREKRKRIDNKVRQSVKKKMRKNPAVIDG